MKTLKNYVVMNVADAIMEETRMNSKYDITIQSGCANTDKRIAELCDNVGDNISEWNPYYSELTAMYWVWKHEKADYIGWSHYRRRLDITDEEIQNYIEQDIDAILAEPMSFEETMMEQFMGCVSIDCWQVMMDVMCEIHPEEYEIVNFLANQKFMFPACMGIYKYEYFVDCCEWMFPMLEMIKERIGERWDPYQRRYIAFLAERMMSIFHVLHGEQAKIQIAPLKLFDTRDQVIQEKEETEESIISNIQGYLQEGEASRARLYLGDVITQKNIEVRGRLYNLLCALWINRYEAVYSQESLCKYHKNAKLLADTMGEMIDLLNNIANGEVVSDEVLKDVIKRLKISKMGLEFLVQQCGIEGQKILQYLQEFWIRQEGDQL